MVAGGRRGGPASDSGEGLRGGADFRCKIPCHGGAMCSVGDAVSSSVIAW